MAQTPLPEATAQTDEETCLGCLLVRGGTEESFLFFNLNVMTTSKIFMGI